MSKTLCDALPSNHQHPETFHVQPSRPVNRTRKFAILTCMDACLNPERFAALDEFHAYVVHNAGGRASEDAIRSLVMSHDLLGTHEWLIVHHSGCGIAATSDRLTAHNIVTDVQRTRNHPLVPSWVSISGYLIDARTGELKPVPGAISPAVRIAAPSRRTPLGSEVV